MRARNEFTFHKLGAPDALGSDESLELLGAAGWEIRGITALSDDSVVVALQRARGDDAGLPDASTLAAALDVPLSAPSEAELLGE